MTNQYVVPQADGQWMVHPADDIDVHELFDTEDDAINHAEEAARDSGGDVLIHDEQGNIAERRSVEGKAAPDDAQYSDEESTDS
jgi:hypothetical protein